MSLIRKHGAVLQAWACLALVKMRYRHTCTKTNLNGHWGSLQVIRGNVFWSQWKADKGLPYITGAPCIEQLRSMANGKIRPLVDDDPWPLRWWTKKLNSRLRPRGDAICHSSSTGGGKWVKHNENSSGFCKPF